MKYKMYDEIIEQPNALRETFDSELSKMNEASEVVKNADKIYIIGCGSSISTCYSVRDALRMVTTLNIEVYTGYEFLYNKRLSPNEKSIAIFTSQSGETADTLAALRRANELDILSISISNEPESSMIKESKIPIITRGGTETAILGTKTYVTQLACLYYVLFKESDYEDANKLVNDLLNIPDLIEELIESTHDEYKTLAKKFKDDDIFYCLGAGPNFGLSYKLAMTMFMEGAIKHACPEYSSEFRHGLIERAEKDVPLIFLYSDFEADVITKKAIDFAETVEAKSLVLYLDDFANVNKLLSPFVFIAPLEWFIYYLAHYNGEDPGATRHIGKVRYE